MAIRTLPDYMIKTFKAGEVIERPASVVKELVENSLDAGATAIKIFLNDGGKTLISVEDDGAGIELTDMDFLFERYTTSKIYGEQDLLKLKSYGFRGEALAAISQVSKVTIVSKTAYSEMASKLVKLGQSLTMNHLPAGFERGTIVTIENLFHDAPTKLTSLKSSQTEFFYCYNYFVDVALYHYDISFALYKNDKPVLVLPKVDSLLERIVQVHKKDRSQHLQHIQTANPELHLTGLVSDSALTFGSGDNIKIYIDGRPVQDKIIKRALMDAYAKHIPSNEYPFAVLMLATQPGVVDINVRPDKSEVKFANPQHVYQMVYGAIGEVLGSEQGIVNSEQGKNSKAFRETDNVGQEHGNQYVVVGDYKIVGQLWEKYIVLEGGDGIYYVDQGRLAERIVYERMRVAVRGTGDAVDISVLKPEIMSQPLLLEIPEISSIHQKIAEVNELGFDCSLFSENRVIVYAIPQIFVIHKVDMDILFAHIFSLEQMSFATVCDKILQIGAFKTPITSGDVLSSVQMAALMQEGIDTLGDIFAHAYEKPFFVKSDRKELDKFFG